MDDRTLDERVRTLAAAQHATVGRKQLRAAGASRQAVARRQRSGALVPVTPRVLRIAGAPVTAEQRAMAAVLDAGDGAVLSHRSAAALWGLAGFDLKALHVSLPRARDNRPTALARVHRPLALPAHHCSVRSGIPVTTLARTVLDLAGTEHVLRFERAVHAAVRLGVTWLALARIHAELPARRPGSARVRSLLAENAGLAPFGSGLEADVVSLLGAAGLPAPRRQVDLGGQAWVGRVDFSFEDAGLVLEIDGAWCHESPPDVRHDRRRTEALQAAGFRVLRIPEEVVRRRPGEVVRVVRAALGGAA